MLTVATDRIEGRRIVAYLGIVNGDAILGAKMIRDFFGGIRDAVGGRVGGYEKALRGAKDAAFEDPIEEAHALGANAVVGSTWITRPWASPGSWSAPTAPRCVWYNGSPGTNRSPSI